MLYLGWNTRILIMLTAVHDTAFSSRSGCQILKDEKEFSFLKVSRFPTTGELRIGEDKYEFEGRGFLRRRFSLNHGAQILATARITFFRSRFEVRYQEHKYTVKKRGVFESGYCVLEHGSQLGVLIPNKTFATETALIFPEDWPDVLSVFVFWLTHYQRPDDVPVSVM